MGDLLWEDYSLAQKDKPYRCLDLLLKHRDELFEFLKGQWGNLFGAKYDVLLYDLTSTYFESDPPAAGSESKNVLDTAVTNVRIVFKWSWHWC